MGTGGPWELGDTQEGWARVMAESTLVHRVAEAT